MAKRPYNRVASHNRRYDLDPDAGETHLVYWIGDDMCEVPERDGYVGCTGKPAREISRKLRRFPHATKVEILFRGTQEECLAVESKLRPNTNMGWNIGVGGFTKGQGLGGVPKPAEQRDKMSTTASARYAERKPLSPSHERARLAKNAKRAARRAAGLPRLY